MQPRVGNASAINPGQPMRDSPTGSVYRRSSRFRGFMNAPLAAFLLFCCAGLFAWRIYLRLLEIRNLITYLYRSRMRPRVGNDSAILGIESLDSYYQRRLLRWEGHVSRMPIDRLPRVLLTWWVANPRPIGCPQMT